MYHHTQTYSNLLYNSFCKPVYFVFFIPLFCISFYFLYELNKNDLKTLKKLASHDKSQLQWLKQC